MKWEPIETAPRDGHEVLLCRNVDASGQAIQGDAIGIHMQVAAWWEDEDEDDGGEWIVYCSLITEPRLHFEPTHWMPLPAMPEAK
jgi:uncharacterized protein DUF551